MASNWIGRTLSKVEIQESIGRGGMAEVFLGRHTTLNRPVAIKILHTHLSDDDKLLQRFSGEAQAVAGLRHPNIVQVFDYDFVDDEYPYIVMELLDGLSLKDYLDNRHIISTDEMLQFVIPLASALDYAHNRGIVHRDIKPANVMLRNEAGELAAGQPLPADVEPILTDFGIAHISDSSRLTASGMAIGTPAYMSPEQVKGIEIDARSDIYSLGIMVYELLAGELPFDGETQASILVKHVTEQPKPLPGADKKLQDVLDRVLAKEPEQRFQTAGELAQALQYALGVPGVAAPAVMSDPLTTMAVPVSAGQTITDATLESSGINSLLVAGGSVVAVLVLGILGLFLGGVFNGGIESPRSPSEEVLEAAPVATTDTPVGTLFLHDGELLVVLRDLQPTPEGSVYEAWLINMDGGVESLGLIEDKTAITFESNNRLLTTYSSFFITLEPTNDSDPVASGDVTYVAEFDPILLEQMRLLHEVGLQKNAEFANALLDGLEFQAGQYNSHLGFATNDIESGNLNNSKIHAEHIVNIVSGVASPDYGDLNGDDRTENPGDEFGLHNYLLLLSASAQGAAQTPGTDADSRAVAELVTQQAEDTILAVEDGQRFAEQIAAQDTIEDAQALLEFMREAQLSSDVDTMIGQARNLTLSFAVDIFPAQ